MPLVLASYQNFTLPQQLFDAADDSFQTKSLDSLAILIRKLVQDNGLAAVAIEQQTSASSNHYSGVGSITVTHKNKLIAIIDVSIQPAPFSQAAFTAYTQETIAAGHNFQKAYREGAYGNTSKPFIGSITLLTDQPTPAYLLPYQDFCKRMMMERLYTASTLLIAGDIFPDLKTVHSEMTSLKSFISALAGHTATETAKQSLFL